MTGITPARMATAKRQKMGRRRAGGVAGLSRLEIVAGWQSPCEAGDVSLERALRGLPGRRFELARDLLLQERLEMALIMPPLGLKLYVVQSARTSGSLSQVMAGAAPYALVMLAMVGLLILFPGLALRRSALERADLERAPERAV